MTSPPAQVRPARLGRCVLALFGLALVARRAAAARRELDREAEQPVVELPGRPRLVSVVGGTRPHGETGQPPDVLLTPGRVVVGRAKDAEVRLVDTTVSPRHALLETSPEGRVVVRDLGALNGVEVDGVPVAEAELHDGNRLELGHVGFVFRVDPKHDDGGRQGGELGEQPQHAEQGRD